MRKTERTGRNRPLTEREKLAKRILGNRCQIGNLLALPSRRHGNIEGRPARICNILRQAVGRGVTGHKVNQVLATDGNHTSNLFKDRTCLASGVIPHLDPPKR